MRTAFESFLGQVVLGMLAAEAVTIGFLLIIALIKFIRS